MRNAQAGRPALRYLAVVVLLSVAVSAYTQEQGWARESDSRVLSVRGAAGVTLEHGLYPASAGDVNGDGLDDIVVGAPSHHNSAGETPGFAYVVFGKSDYDMVELADFDLNAQGTRGFRIEGTSSRDRAGEDVVGVGDLNEDGLADVAVGAPFAGATYVVFGKSDTSPQDVRRLGSSGYRIVGACEGSLAGYAATASLGDVNGDSKDDMMVGAPSLFGNGAGSVSVVFGKASPSPVKLATVGRHGYSIAGVRHFRDPLAFGLSVTGVGDVNGDGTPDAVVGAPHASFNGKASGSAYLVRIDPESRNRRVADFRRWGRRYDGARRLSFAGSGVANIGDFTGDGRPDVAISANEWKREVSVTYVVTP